MKNSARKTVQSKWGKGWDIALDEYLLDGAIVGTFTCNQCQNKLED